MLMENYVWMFNKSLGPVAPRQFGLWHLMVKHGGTRWLNRGGTIQSQHPVDYTRSLSDTQAGLREPIKAPVSFLARNLGEGLAWL